MKLITMNAYYGFCPGGPPGDGGGSWKVLSLGAVGDGSGCSTSGNGFSSSFAKLKGWPFLCFIVTAPYNSSSFLAQLTPECCIEVISKMYSYLFLFFKKKKKKKKV